MAFVKLFVLKQPLPGETKANLSLLRVASFVTIAWLAAQAVRTGAVRWLAQRLPSIVTVGRTGLVCFVAGTVISLAIDTATFHGQVHGLRGLLIALSGDAATIAAMIGIATLWQWRHARGAAERVASHAREFVRLRFARRMRD